MVVEDKQGSFTYSPMARGHKPTPSQESNTLSQASCVTEVSDVGDHSDGEMNSDADMGLETLTYGDNIQLGYESIETIKDDSIIHVNFVPSRGNGNELTHTVDTSSVTLDIPSEGPKEGLNSKVVPDEPLKTLIGGGFLLTGFLATTISLAFTHDRVPEIAPLPDIVLDNIPDQDWGLTASELLLMISTLSGVIVVLFHYHRLVILRRVWLILGLLYYYRALTMFVTVLPKADQTYVCHPKAVNITAQVVISRALTIISGGGLSINGKHVYCGDYIFSGHTMTLTLGYLVIRQYSPSRYYLLHWASFLTSLCGVVFLLIGRGHYTIDVLLAYYVTTRVWWLYHTLAHNNHLKTKGEHNDLSNIGWWHAFRYFEKNISEPLPRRYSFPLPVGVKKYFWRKSIVSQDA